MDVNELSFTVDIFIPFQPTMMTLVWASIADASTPWSVMIGVSTTFTDRVPILSLATYERSYPVSIKYPCTRPINGTQTITVVPLDEIAGNHDGKLTISLTFQFSDE